MKQIASLIQYSITKMKGYNESHQKVTEKLEAIIICWHKVLCCISKGLLKALQYFPLAVKWKREQEGHQLIWVRRPAECEVVHIGKECHEKLAVKSIH